MIQPRTTEQIERIRAGLEPGFFPLSYSQIKRYQECGLWYKFEYIDKLGKVTGDHAQLGTADHTFQEVLMTEGLEKAAKIARAMVPLTKSKSWLNAKMVIESIEYKKDYLYLAETPLYWEFIIDDTVIQIKSKIDLLFVNVETGTVEPVDGKSGHQVPNEKELKEDPQGKLYAIVALKNLPDLDIKKVLFTQAQWYYGRLVTVPFALDDLKEYELQIQAVAEEMLNRPKLEPTPGNQCHWCPFVLKCDAAQKMLPELVEIAGEKLPPVITSDEDAAAIGMGVIHLEEIIKRYRDALRGHIKETKRSVKIGEGAFDWFRRSTLKIEDLDFLLDLAKKKHIDFASFLNFNNKTGKTLVKNHPEFLEGLVEDQYPFFDYRNKVDEDDS